MNIVF